ARDDAGAAPDGLQRLRGRDPRGRVRWRHGHDLGSRDVGARERGHRPRPRQGRSEDAPGRQKDEGLLGAGAHARSSVAAHQAPRRARLGHGGPHAVQAEVGRLAPQHGGHRARGGCERAAARAGRGRRPTALDREAGVTIVRGHGRGATASPPIDVKPMLATLVDAPFHIAGWVYEEKYDGIRIIAEKAGARVRLITRNLIDRTGDFPEVAAAIAKLPAPTLLLDGEIVVFDPHGISRFQLFGADTRRRPVYVLFDCLFARGHNLMSVPLAERRAALEKEARPDGALRLARRLASDGFKAFEAARERGLEGIVAKDA